MILKKVGELLKKIKFDELITEILGLSGIGMIFYGFYTWKPMMAWIVVGTILLFLSILTGIKK